MKRQINICWHEVIWQRPFELQAVYDVLTHLASTVPRGPVVWEVRASGGKIRYLLGADRDYLSKTQNVFKAHGDVRFAAIGPKDFPPVTTAQQLKITRPVLSLKTDTALSTIRAGLAAMSGIPKNAEAVLQIVLGPSYAPTPAPREMPDPHASWFQVAIGNVKPASNESMSAIRDKAGSHSFAACVRLGVSGISSHDYIYRILSALKTLETAGVRISVANESPEAINVPHIPWHFPLRLSIKELANLFMLPVGDTALSGVSGLHPKTILPPRWYKNPTTMNDRSFAVSGNTRLSISPNDALEHTIILGPTGSGKSTAMQNLILADIKANKSVMLLDPKADLVNSILSRIPPEREKDVVVIDPSDPCPVGFNPLGTSGGADAVLAVFKGVFSENWGIRTQDVLSAALLTLEKTKGATLLWLLPLLTDEAFRAKITSKLNDKIGLEPFWAGFEAMKDSERRAEIAPVLNKLRQFLLRPGLRNVLGQSQPKFDLNDLFLKRKIVLVPLNKGTIGAESAQLLGSFIVGLAWTLIQARADIPQERRHMVGVHIDEVQDYLRLPTSLAESLAQARSLGAAFTLAHQYRAQLPPDLQAGIDTNARNKIVFGLNATDAKAMAAMAPELEAEDFMMLPRYNVYASFQSGGRNTGWVSGQTLPPSAALRLPAELRAKSMAAYGKPAEEIEAEYLAMMQHNVSDTPPDEGLGGLGRRKIV